MKGGRIRNPERDGPPPPRLLARVRPTSRPVLAEIRANVPSPFPDVG